jgi:hypothetical protein
MDRIRNDKVRGTARPWRRRVGDSAVVGRDARARSNIVGWVAIRTATWDAPPKLHPSSPGPVLVAASRGIAIDGRATALLRAKVVIGGGMQP